MADQKISDLTAVTSLASDDEFVVVDTSESASNKITLSNATNSGLLTKLTTNNSLLIRNDSGSVAQVAMADRDALYCAASGTIIGNSGRNFLDSVMRGPTSSADALNYQPHYVEFWQGSTGSHSVGSYPAGGAATGIGAVYMFNAGGTGGSGAGYIRIPVASSSNAGDTIYLFNRSTASAYIRIEEFTSLEAPDQDDAGDGAKNAGAGWRLYYGDYLVLHCKQNEDASDLGYYWFQVGGTSHENRRELFVTASGLDFTAQNQYCPGDITIRVTADAQSFTLPQATERRYRIRLFMATGGTDSATLARDGTDTITAVDGTDTGNTLVTVGGSSATAYVELWTQGDGVWHAIADNDTAYTTP